MATVNAINSSDPIEVAKGGTGNATLTAYAVLCAGTTGTGALQPIASVGTANQVLTSNGAAALPTFQTAPSLDVDFEVVAGDPGAPTDGDIWFDSVEILCTTADTTWVVLSSKGNITIVQEYYGKKERNQ